MIDHIKPFTRPWEDTLKDLNVSADNGLSTAEVSRRLKQYGPNRLREVMRKSASLILLNQFKSLIVLLLAVAALLSFAFKSWVEDGGSFSGLRRGTVLVVRLRRQPGALSEALKRLI